MSMRNADDIRCVTQFQVEGVGTERIYQSLNLKDLKTETIKKYSLWYFQVPPQVVTLYGFGFKDLGMF